jgi:putative sterol carrier protein
MVQLRVKEGVELNGLGVIIKQAVEKNLENPKKAKKVDKLNASVVIRETTTDVAITLNFKEGDIVIQNDAVEKPSVTFSGTFQTLGDVLLGEVGPIRSVLTRKTKARGNILKLMKAQNVIILGKQKPA